MRYLVLIGEIDVLPQLFGTVHVPPAVRAELCDRRTPLEVRRWVGGPPSWLVMQTLEQGVPRKWANAAALDQGEAEALALAAALKTPLILMDDRAGVTEARAAGFAVTGTLGILDVAARAGLIDLAAAFARLRATNFRCRGEIMDDLLALYQRDRGTA